MLFFKALPSGFFLWVSEWFPRQGKFPFNRIGSFNRKLYHRRQFHTEIAGLPLTLSQVQGKFFISQELQEASGRSLTTWQDLQPRLYLPFSDLEPIREPPWNCFWMCLVTVTLPEDCACCSPMCLSMDGIWVCATPGAMGMVGWIENTHRKRQELYLFLQTQSQL